MAIDRIKTRMISNPLDSERSIYESMVKKTINGVPSLVVVQIE